MPKPHRYTGAFPPIEVLAQYPNWQNALEEEGEDGQDETTIRPADEQTYIAEFVTFTAADAVLASGEHAVAIGCVIESVGIAYLYVFNGTDWWELRYDEQTQLWRPFTPTYIPEPERPPTVSLSDTSIFPLRFTTRVPFEPGGEPFTATINPDGREQ
jgi:hypothetical protein